MVCAGNQPVLRDRYSYLCGARRTSSRATFSCLFSDAWWKRGRNCIKLLWGPIGQSYRRGVDLHLLSHCDKYRMTHAIHEVRSFEVVAQYILRICFEDGTAQTIDFRPILAGEIYGPLQDPALFNRVEIDPEARTLVWPNGADFDPATLHDWPEYEREMREMARRWNTVRA